MSRASCDFPPFPPRDIAASLSIRICHDICVTTLVVARGPGSKTLIPDLRSLVAAVERS